MIGIDTNVLLRYLVDDEKEQANRVHRLLAASRRAGEHIYVSCIVLCETAWVLRRAYALSGSEVLDDIERVLNADIFQVEEADSVRRAVELSRNERGDFADHLIGELNRDHGCRVTVTFDRALRSDPASSVL